MHLYGETADTCVDSIKDVIIRIPWRLFGTSVQSTLRKFVATEIDETMEIVQTCLVLQALSLVSCV